MTFFYILNGEKPKYCMASVIININYSFAEAESAFIRHRTVQNIPETCRNERELVILQSKMIMEKEK